LPNVPGFFRLNRFVLASSPGPLDLPAFNVARKITLKAGRSRGPGDEARFVPLFRQVGRYGTESPASGKRGWRTGVKSLLRAHI
jgi:hypothetical protein